MEANLASAWKCGKFSDPLDGTVLAAELEAHDPNP
jgi:hypothetical protein